MYKNINEIGSLKGLLDINQKENVDLNDILVNINMNEDDKERGVYDYGGIREGGFLNRLFDVLGIYIKYISDRGNYVIITDGDISATLDFEEIDECIYYDFNSLKTFV